MKTVDQLIEMLLEMQKEGFGGFEVTSQIGPDEGFVYGVEPAINRERVRILS